MTITDEPIPRTRGATSDRERGVPRPPDADADRAVVALFELLARRHTAPILYVFARDPGPWRYGDLVAALSIPQHSLTRRLADLTEAGLLDRRAYAEIPPRVEYTATDRAEALKPVFATLYRWSRTAADASSQRAADDASAASPLPDRR